MDNNQIDYIIKVRKTFFKTKQANLQIEKYQLTVILRIIRTRQLEKMRDRENEADEFSKSKNAFFSKNSVTSMKISMQKTINSSVTKVTKRINDDFNDDEAVLLEHFPKEINDIFVGIFSKYEKLNKTTHEKEYEELSFKKIMLEIKNKLTDYKNNKEILSVSK